MLYVPPGLTVKEKLLLHTDVTEECWEWKAYRNPQGYGIFTHNKRTSGAHRFSYEEFVGPIPEGLTLDHLCRNRACINPNHLEPVTLAENIRRGRSLQTHCKRGHLLAGANLRPNRNKRDCYPCERERKRLKRERQPGGNQP